MARIVWKKDGWTTVQEANTEKHIAEISCRSENGMVVEVRARTSRGEEQKVDVLLNGKRALPMSIEDFQHHFNKEELELR